MVSVSLQGYLIISLEEVVNGVDVTQMISTFTSFGIS